MVPISGANVGPKISVSPVIARVTSLMTGKKNFAEKESALYWHSLYSVGMLLAFYWLAIIYPSLRLKEQLNRIDMVQAYWFLN